MGEAALLEPPEAPEVEGAEEATGPEEVPSVFSVSNRYLVGAAEVSDPAPDGSQVIRLASATGSAVIEANLSPELCEFISGKLKPAPKVITADDEEDESAAGAS